ncbi:thiamine pyrophosphate-binding protein [Nesterenkonia flava]|uniref:Thiamine pyrophosphate-binding protein n=1 Tax=Nesterenkonia flava TaxID=469799 RepID=A0ABU1FQL6_9MICC|nr:thiamine pyrophosphate-binding protein [Nesterenkonia flava]MDR5710934.1 thiamine pyrophosphate-binding protein [Nesterenkonia flava]
MTPAAASRHPSPSTHDDVGSSALTVSEAVGSTLVRLGVRAVFGVVGSGNFTMVNALRAHGATFTAARHEGGAATMADAYGRLSGTVPVVSTHQGCGLTNAVTGIAEAAKSRTPMIVLTADTGAAAVLSNFRIDQDALASSIGAVAERIHSPATAVADTARAFRTAVLERRTVVLSVPIDLLAQPAGAAPVPAAPQPQRVRPTAHAVEAVVQALQAAERPVIIAGRGARHAGEELLALAQESGALTATSAAAHGLFGQDPFHLGISGGFSSDFTAATIAEADLILAFGCALNMWTMRHGSLISDGATVIQVDVEQTALGAHRPVTLGVLGDAAETAQVVRQQLSRQASPPPEGGFKQRTPRMREAVAAGARKSTEAYEDLTGDGVVDPRTLSIALDRALPAERVVTIDSGNFMGYPAAYLQVPDERGFCMTQAFQSIGLGLYTAIGAAKAVPERLTVLGTGDGGFLMSIAELETAVREELPMVVIVYNDAAYGAEVHHFEATAQEMEIVRFPETDIAAIARGFGAEGMTVRGTEDLDAVVERLHRGVDSVLVIDAKIASDGGSWWLAEAFKGH